MAVDDPRPRGRRTLAVLLAILVTSSLVLLARQARLPWQDAEGRVDPPVPAAPDADRWSEAECWFTRERAARCGWLWPTRQDAAAQTRLPVVVLQAGPRPSRHATVYLPGGPGGSAYLGFDSQQHWDDWSETLGLDHDLVLYDPRGTGLARPSLDCAPMVEAMRDSLRLEATTPAQLDQLWLLYERALQRCAERVAPGDRAARLYSTPVHARDLLELVATLRREQGYDHVSLYGVSWGSRLAAAAAAADASAIERVVLDAWYPAGVDLDTRTPRNWREALDDFAAWCGGTRECGKDAATLRAGVAALISRAPLARRVVDVSLDDYGEDGRSVAVRLDSYALVEMLMHAISAGVDPEGLPQLVADAQQGRWTTAWGALAADWLVNTLDPDFNLLALELTECADSGEVAPAAQAALRLQYPEFGPLLREAPRQAGYCARLGVATSRLAASAVHVPALVVSNRLDPVTPWRAAFDALGQLPQGHWRLLDQAGHGTGGVDACGSRAIGAWLNAGQLKPWRACALLAARDPDPAPPSIEAHESAGAAD